MMIISDNSALSALAESGHLELLPRLFGTVVIPEAVQQECLHPGAPDALREWIQQPPLWISINADPPNRLPETEGLGSGEAAAISLAWQHRASASLILDEKRGRRVAQSLGLPMTGVLGILGESASRGWIHFDKALEKLTATGFHLSEPVIQAVRDRLAL